jgi:uncharacterized NAD-dependent epimerase/dehydratase family protein
LARADLDIFTGYDTDKGYHHTYEIPYQRELESRRKDVKGVLEIGIYHGGSLKAWRDYFPNATVVGMDIDDGSHRPIDQFQALKYLWQFLNPGGLYVVEDLDLNRDASLLNTFGMIVRGETSDIRIHLGDSEVVRNDDLLILEKR